MKNPLQNKILFLKIKNQDSDAYGKFYDSYVNRIYRFIFFKVNSASDAQDLTSEVFLKVWQYIKEGKDIKNLNAFIYLVARNSVIDFYRSKSRQMESNADEEILPQISDNKQDLFGQQEIESDLGHVLEGMENLKDEYKEVIVLRFLDELSITEISEVIKKSKGSTRVLIYRAIKALKENIKDDEK